MRRKKSLLDPIKCFIKVAGFKINIQIIIAFQNVTNTQFEDKIKKKFYLKCQENKILVINLTKE